MKKQLLIIITLFAAGLAGFMASRTVFAPAAPAVAEAGTTLPTPRPLPEFSLPQADDQATADFSRDSLSGHWSLVFFGFTNCPDVCPNTLFMLDKVVKDFSERTAAKPPRVVFISVDPQRDNPEKTAEYAKYFNEDFIGVSGQSADLATITQGMSVAYGYEEQEDDYTVNHSSTVILIDPQARMHTIFTPPLKADAIVNDLVSITGEES